MAISAPGLGSGLDISGIVSQLMQVERLPLNRLINREATVQAQISAVGSLKSAVSEFQSAVARLAEEDTFEAIETSVGDPDVLSVSADSDAALGGFSVEVLRLAQAHKQASEAKGSADMFGGGVGDELVITAGAGSLTIDLSTAKTLSQIREEIVSATGADVSATLIDETGDGSSLRLVLSSTETGYDNRLQLSFGGAIDATTFGFSTINQNAEGVTLTEAELDQLDASFTLDGFTLTRSSNTVDDAITGVNLELKQLGATTVSVSRDSSGIGQAAGDLVEAYNALSGDLSELRQGALGNDSLVRQVEQSLRSMLGRSFSGLGAFRTLNDFGISFTREGTLEFDQSALDAAVTADRSSVEVFFRGEGGFASRLDDVLSGYLDSSGIIDARVDGLNARVDDLQDQQARWEVRLIDIEERYLAQFSALDSLVAQLNNTSAYLTQQLQNLPGFTFNSER
jgi:flagellar hook-associated protein 2